VVITHSFIIIIIIIRIRIRIIIIIGYYHQGRVQMGNAKGESENIKSLTKMGLFTGTPNPLYPLMRST